MLTRDQFVEFILGGARARVASPNAAGSAGAALPEGFEGFEEETKAPEGDEGSESFARQLLLATFSSQPADVSRESVIRGADQEAVARHLPARVSYWPKDGSRPYQTLLFETSLTHKQLLGIPAFKSRSLEHLDIVEDALARLVSEALTGFQKGSTEVKADVRKGRRDETLCIVSIVDEREGQPVRLVCFGTENKKTGGLETFQITEQTRLWDPQLAREHLGLVYERQFKKLPSADWQEAFTTTDERKQAERLLEVCTGKKPTEDAIQEAVLDLLDTVAKGFGLRKKPGGARRLQAYALPADHDIGIDPEEREGKHGGANPFGGVTLRDERNRLLGYIVYPLKTKADATRLRKYLAENNRFHNVLVVYPDVDRAHVELWQGREALEGKLRKNQEGYKDAANVVNLLSRFFVVSRAKVRNPTELAQELAYRARYLKRLAAKELDDQPKKGPLRDLFNAFKEALVHDQTEEQFADAFAQTLTYGLLTARWLGNEQIVAAGERFTRQTAVKYLPSTSPFLTDLFRSALSVKMDEQRGRLLWLVDDIADLLDRVDVTYVFGAGDAVSDKATDPVIHFYEPFLAAYDKELKNKRGVFFTPRPVVSYIVRSVHELLRTEFGLEDGLASTDTWGDVVKRIEGLKLPEGVRAEDPFVCILDPATGTGTFLFEVIEVIERTMKDRWCAELGGVGWGDARVISRWAHYVPDCLLPRMYGYELMMASYAVAHLKLSFKLSETGYRLVKTDRLHVYLTNSLDGPSKVANSKLAHLFASLATQAQEVDAIKRHRRFTVIVGNPPYAGHSSNSGEWARALVDRYRKIGNEELHLSQSKWLQNDYVKFVALAETTVAQSRAGVWGFITDNSYLDGDTFPGLRHRLLSEFSGLEVLNLHGSLTRREASPDGSVDENVFDIQQGVAVALGWRSVRGSSLGSFAVADLWGTRSAKFSALLNPVCRAKLDLKSVSSFDDRYLFIASSEQADEDGEYDKFDGVDAIFSENGKPAPGFLTTHDSFAIAFTKSEIISNVETVAASKNEDEARESFKLCSQEQWQYRVAKPVLQRDGWRKQIRSCLYRPFDRRWTVYDPHVLVHRRERVNSHLLEPGNLALLTTRMTKGDDFAHVFVTDRITEVICLSSKTSANAFVFPLFLHNDAPMLPGMKLSEARVNIAPSALKLYRSLAGKAVLPRSVFTYCYAVLHSPEYRKRYNARLIREFPRVPRPATADLFAKLAASGEALVRAHLLEGSAALGRLRGKGDNVVASGMPKYNVESQRIQIGPDQYFDNVRREVWEFRVGSYDVCKKWLSERRGLVLSADDCAQFLTIVSAIDATLVEQRKIDQVISKHGGWPAAFLTTGATP